MPDDSSADRAPRPGPGGDRTRAEDLDVLRDLARRIDPLRPIGPLSLRLRTRRRYVLAGVAVVALLGGGGADVVLDNSGVPAVAAAAHGGYAVRQTGVVTSVTGTSVTLRSADGTEQRYAVAAATVVDSGRGRIGSIRPGDEVSVQGVARDGGLTATRVSDLTLQQAGARGAAISGPGWGGPGNGARAGTGRSS